METDMRWRADQARLVPRSDVHGEMPMNERLQAARAAGLAGTPVRAMGGPGTARSPGLSRHQH
eukprot:3403599-Rhodomonas_salina.1